MTSEEGRYIPRRQGDPQHIPAKILPTTDIFTTSSPIRGRFLLEMLNATEQLIANGRFEIQGSNKIPATFHRCERHANPPKVERTIIDYIMINKQHWDTVITCKIHEGSGMNIGYDAAKPDKNACDHELITITLEVPGSDIPLNHYSRKKPPRKQYLVSKLKDKKVSEKFKKALEKLSPNMNKHMQEQKQKYIKKQITKQDLANKLHQIFASHIQKASQDILGETSAYLPDPDKPPPTKHEKETYLDHVSPESRALHKKISDIIKATQLAITLRKPQSEIDQLYIQVAEARNQ